MKQRADVDHVPTYFHPSPFILGLAGYANRQSGEVESLVIVGSTPTSVTHKTIAWSNGASVVRTKTGFN